MRFCVGFGCCLVLLGCGGGGGGPTVEVAPVSGVVMLDGKPVANAVVTFFPENGPTGIGIANEQGEFTVKTNGRTGAPIGKSSVTVVPGTNASGDIPETDGNEIELTKQSVIDTKYASRETTDLKVDVTPDGHENLQLDVTSAGS